MSGFTNFGHKQCYFFIEFFAQSLIKAEIFVIKKFYSKNFYMLKFAKTPKLQGFSAPVS